MTQRLLRHWSVHPAFGCEFTLDAVRKAKVAPGGERGPDQLSGCRGGKRDLAKISRDPDRVGGPRSWQHASISYGIGADDFGTLFAPTSRAGPACPGFTHIVGDQSRLRSPIPPLFPLSPTRFPVTFSQSSLSFSFLLFFSLSPSGGQVAWMSDDLCPPAGFGAAARRSRPKEVLAGPS